MFRNSLFLNLAAIGLGLAVSGHLSAQSSTSGTSGNTQTSGSTSGASGTGSSTGGVVNLRDQPTGGTTSSGGAGIVRMSDLLNYRIQAQDGAFGRVSDLVFDRNGNLQYLLGSHQGQTFPLPFLPSALSGTGNTLTFNVPIATLQQLSINPQNLPTLQNQAFAQRMQQVFGPSFANNLSAYPPGMTSQTGTGATGAGTGTRGAGSTAGARGSTTGAGPTIGGAANSTTGTTGTGAPGRAGMNNDNWNWPANPAGIVPGTGNGRFATPPGVPRGGGVGAGTANNAGIRSNTGTMNNSTIGGRTATGAGGTTGTGTTGSTSGAGTSGSTSGSGTRGTTSGTGSGTSGSGTGGTTGSGTSGSGTSGGSGSSGS